jgi:hypothetical protein
VIPGNAITAIRWFASSLDMKAPTGLSNFTSMPTTDLYHSTISSFLVVFNTKWFRTGTARRRAPGSPEVSCTRSADVITHSHTSSC